MEVEYTHTYIVYVFFAFCFNGPGATHEIILPIVLSIRDAHSYDVTEAEDGVLEDLFPEQFSHGQFFDICTGYPANYGGHSNMR